jgi:phage-related protein
MTQLSRNQLIVVLSCVESEIQKVEEFVAGHGGKENTLNTPHNLWLEIARDAQAVLIRQQESVP